MAAEEEVSIGLEGSPLYPFPLDLIAEDFTLQQLLRNEPVTSSTFQVEYRLLSAVHFRVQSSKRQPNFESIFENKNLKAIKSKTIRNCYDVNIRHYWNVFSNVEYIQEKMYLRINYNRLDKELMNCLIKNLRINENILSFIRNPDDRKTLIESFEYNEEFGKAFKLMNDSNFFDLLFEPQLTAFYVSVLREGKAILADMYGKSLIAIAIMTYFKRDWPLLIVCDAERKSYWSKEVDKWLTFLKHLKHKIVNHLNDIYVYPKPLNDIMIIDYDFYYEIKDTISFKCLDIKALIFEDQCRGDDNENNRQWRGLSTCKDNLKRAKRIIFVFSSDNLTLDSPKKLYPLLEILDSNTFNDFETFSQRYVEKHSKRDQCLKELEILLNSSFLVNIKTLKTNEY